MLLIKRIAKFVDQENETKLSRLESRFTSIHFTVNLINKFFEKSMRKIHNQNSAVTSLGISLGNLSWFENNKGNLVFTSKPVIGSLMSSHQKKANSEFEKSAESNFIEKKMRSRKKSESDWSQSEANQGDLGGQDLIRREELLELDQGLHSDSDDDYSSFLEGHDSSKFVSKRSLGSKKKDEEIGSTRRNSDLEPVIKMRYHEFGTLFK